MQPLWRLIKLMKPSWIWLMLGLGASVLTLLANTALLSLAAWFVTCMALAGAGVVTFSYTLPLAALHLLAGLRILGRYAERLLSHEGTFRLLTGLRVFFFSRLEPLAPAALHDLHSGDLFGRIKADIDQLDEFYLRIALPISSAAIVLCLILIFLGYFSWMLAGYLLVLWFMAGIALPLLTMRLGYASGREQVFSMSRMRTQVVDLIRGLEELTVFGKNQEFLNRLTRENRTLCWLQTKSARLQGLSEAGMTLMLGLALWGMLFWAIPHVQNGTLTPEHLSLLAVLALISFEAVQQLPGALQAWGRIRASAERLFQIIDREPAIQVPESFSHHPRNWEIEFREVHFTYPDSSEPALANASFRAGEGEKLGVVGATGSGKTSLINLILRFYPFSSGDILLGGRSICDYHPEKMRSWIGVIAQQPYLFNSSIRENLLLAHPEAEEPELYAALRTARLEEFVLSLPDKLDTQVGRAGLSLSGGQARRVAIARTILKQAPILLLDEPTEGLDPQTEQDLLSTLEPLMAGRTVLFITHKEKGLQYMDRVLSMEQGMIQPNSAPKLD